MNRHERRRAAKQYGGGYVGPGAAMEFLRRYAAASNDAEMEIRDAELANGTLLLACKIEGYTAALTPHEARMIADAAESALQKFPNEPEAAALPNLIMGMRAAADKLDVVIREKSVESINAHS